MVLIVIEGLDASGKGTQIELLRQKYPDLISFKYPTKSFDILNQYLDKKIEIDRKSLFLLFLADIANEQNKIKEAMKKSKLVVVDRYVFSTIAYELDSINYEQAKKIVADIGFIKPDKVILLNIDAKTAQERKSKQKKLDRYEENRDYLEKVRNNFLKLHKDGFLAKWHKIDATKEIEAVNKEILKLLEQ